MVMQTARRAQLFWCCGLMAAIAATATFVVNLSDAAPPRTYRRPTTRPAPRPPAKPTPTATATKPPNHPGSTSNVPSAPKTAEKAIPQPPKPRREGEAPPADATVATPKSAPMATLAPVPMKPVPTKSATDDVPKTTATPQVASPATKPDAPKPASPTTVMPQPRTSRLFDPPPIETKPDQDGRYVFRYNFSKGETVRWEVVHEAKFVTTVQGSTQTAETTTKSVKLWKITDIQAGGEATFVHMVESVDMRQKLTGRQEIRFDSRNDKEAPPIFAEAAKAIGVPLSEVTIDNRGNLIKRADRLKRPEGTPTNTIAIVLPDRPLAIGESWTSPYDLTATDGEGHVRTLKARHKLTLRSVTDHTAVLENATQILSPIDDPALEAQVVQAEQSGEIVFDLRRGRIVSQTSKLDKEVFGFQGEESKLHYTAQFSERLIEADGIQAADDRTTSEDKTARKPGTAAK